VKRRLRDAGLLGRVAKKKPYLRLANKNKRFKMGKRTDTGQRKIGKVLWTNKYKFEVFRSQRKTFVRRRKNEKMLEKCLTLSVKHGGGNVIVWGALVVVKWEISNQIGHIHMVNADVNASVTTVQ
jgi:hypothetical protein